MRDKSEASNARSNRSPDGEGTLRAQGVRTRKMIVRAATRLLLKSGGLDLTLRVWITEQDVQKIATLPNQLGKTLDNVIRTWWTFRDLDRNHPHDPLAALAMIHPEIFRFEYADVKVGSSGRDFAKTMLTHLGHGRVRLASDVLVRTAEKEIVRRIVA